MLNYEFDVNKFFLSIFWIIDIFIILVIIFKYVKGIYERTKNIRYFKDSIIYVDDSKKLYYTDIDASTLDKFDIENLSLLKSSLYEIFLFFEYAYNNFDFNRMKMFCTNELYNNYCTNIDLCMRTGKKKIIQNMMRNKDVVIFDIKSDEKKTTVYTMIDINYVSYTVNKLGLIVSGKKSPVNERFEVVFIKEFNEEIINCPNCGAPLKGRECEFCNSVIPNATFRISSIRKIMD